MITPSSVWIAPTGLRKFDPDATHTTVPVGDMMAAGLSFTAMGLYAEVLSYQGAPVNPYVDSLDSPDEIDSAVQELVDYGFVVRVNEPVTTTDADHKLGANDE